LKAFFTSPAVKVVLPLLLGAAGGFVASTYPLLHRAFCAGGAL